MNKIWTSLGLLKMFDTVEKNWIAKSAKIISGSLESEKSGPYRSILGT